MSKVRARGKCNGRRRKDRRTTSARSNRVVSKHTETTRRSGLIPAPSVPAAAVVQARLEQESSAFPERIRYPQLVMLLAETLRKKRVGNETVCGEVADIAVRGLLDIIRKALVLRRPVNLLRVCSLTPYRRRKTRVYHPVRAELVAVPARWAVRHEISQGLKRALNPRTKRKVAKKRRK